MRQYFVVDAFTNRRFSGNPAAVVPLDQWLPDDWLQNVALEMNLAETAYMVPAENGYDLRWFTPQAEVDLCGHATIAAAIVLAKIGKLSDGASVNFSTRSGILGAARQGTRIYLDFPTLAVQPCDPVPGLLEALNVSARYVGRGKFDFLVEVESETVLRNIRVDYASLARLNCRGVAVTAGSDNPQFDFVSRFFAPAVGINEDPVTGSAHCFLAPFWASRLGKNILTGYQASPRGGTVYVELRGERAILGGDGVIFATGELEA